MTGVQTCALPISDHVAMGKEHQATMVHAAHAGNYDAAKKATDKSNTSFNKAFKRIKGVDRATRSLARKEIKTEEVQIDELSKGTLASYAKKAADDTALRARYDNRDQPSPTKKTIKRLLGTKKAIDKLAKEEVQIDEISKETLKSYIPKAARSARIHGQISTEYKKAAETKRKPGLKNALDNLSKKYKSKAWRREDGIKRAVDKLTKEAVEHHLVHVSDGSKYDETPHSKDIEHVKKGAMIHGGKWDGHSDKGAYFKFQSKQDAENFKQHVNKCPHRSCHADLSEDVNYDKPTYLRNNPKEPSKKSAWTGFNTDEPAYKRKAQHELEKQRLNKEDIDEAFMHKSVEADMQNLSSLEFYKKYGKNKSSYKKSHATRTADLERVAESQEEDDRRAAEHHQKELEQQQQELEAKKKKEKIKESRGHKILATFFKNREIAQKAFSGQNKPEEPKKEPEKKEVKEGFDDPKAIAKELIKRHGKAVTNKHIDDIEGERDSRSPLDRDEVMKHVKQLNETDPYPTDEKWTDLKPKHIAGSAKK